MYRLPLISGLERLSMRFSPFEWVVFLVLGLILFASSLTLLLTVSNTFLVEVPSRGGTLTEGVVGLPRFVNPLLAISDADRDIVTLVYSGLMKATPEGNLIPDLAESYSISPDGKTYTFVLKPDLTFQDGTALTADDVLFTINKAEDPTLKSPKRANWDGVLAQKVDDRTITFTLKQSYGPFLENTTLGILPAHIWKNASSEEFPFSQFNVEPIGSGPYKIARVDRSSSGIPEAYHLTPFSHAALGEPFIASFNLRFYPNTESLATGYTRGEINSMTGLSGSDIALMKDKISGSIAEAPLSRLFAVFFNQNQNQIFADKAVRQALDIAIDKDRIVKEVLLGYGSSIEGPIPLREEQAKTPTLPREERLKQAKAILEKGGWTYSLEDRLWEKTVKKSTLKLSFALATGNATEFKDVAEHIGEDWRALGVPVDVQFFEAADLQQGVIRPRKYDALLFGMIVGREMDLFAFWHSSQRNDPGLNVAMYANIAADKDLEKARSAVSLEERDQQLSLFEKEIKNDTPAVFVYAPDFVYVVPNNLKGVALNFVVTPSDRFLSADKWYINTEHVWSLFQGY